MARLAGSVVWIGLLAFGCAHTPADSPAAPAMARQHSPATVATAAKSSSPATAQGEGVGDEFYDENLDFLEEEEPAPVIADPLAPWNRAMFEVNDRLYFWVLKPLAQGYIQVTPSFLRVAVRNLFDHVETPIRFTSCLLQGKLKGAGTELARLILNTVWGFLGTWDAAAYFSGLEPVNEDLGQALGSYGIGDGFYLVWPFFGPSTLRDTVGLVGDRYLNPVTYLEPLAVSASASGLKSVNTVSFHLGDYETIKNAAIDPYDAFRDGYLQLRRKKIDE
jgi:phospholipid-binding lipoprotein MlaA